jgi:hypothetical protein
MTVPPIARAASKTLLLDAEPQYAGKLCWAAADVIAVNHFYPQCPAPTSAPAATPALFPTSQALEAAFHKWAFSGTAPGVPLSSFLSQCELQIGNCSDWCFPCLHGLTFKWGTDPAGLDWDTMWQQIDAGRPVLIVWDYPSNDTTGNSPVGKHELVVIGYSEDAGARQLQIWDPWPVPAEPQPFLVPVCGPASGIEVAPNHSQWIDFSTYSNPMNDMGVTAVHIFDQWDLAVDAAPKTPDLPVDCCATPPVPPLPPSLSLLQPALGAVHKVPFAEALHAALPASRQVNLQVPGAAPRSLGVPFPIVGLGFKQLLGASDDPTGLLTGTTSAILFPVESRGEVVGAFLMLFMEGRWLRGGYANIEVTRRLVDARARYAASQQLRLDSFYMVSVPGEVAFFAAHGKGKQAVFIPASTDPSIDAVAGKAVLAAQQLKKLIRAVQDDLQRYPNRDRDSLRPGQ